jgi:6-phosphogluconolactonase
MAMAFFDCRALPFRGSPPGMTEQTRTVYVGTGNWGADIGKIQVFSLDPATAVLTLRQELDTGGIAAFMARSANGRVLYVADEGKALLSSYAIDESSGELRLLNRVSSAGHPVYVAVDDSGNGLVTCFFAEAKTQVFALAADGSLGESAGVWDSGSESHCTVFAPGQRFLFVPTRGDNWIAQYRYVAATRKLTPNAPARVAELAGAGPRHLAFHPNGQFAYLVNELSQTLSVYAFDAGAGTLQAVQRELGTAAPGVSAGAAAHVQVHPEGRFVYVSNRQCEHSTLAIFAVDASTGRATLVAHESTRGRTPRHFCVDPQGKLLIVGNQDSNDVAVFRVADAGEHLHYVRSYPVPPGPFFVGIY